MQISLPEALTNYIQSKMASGRYHDASALISEALQEKILHDQHPDDATQMLRHEIMLGWDAAERGEFVAFDVAALKKDLDASCHG